MRYFRLIALFFAKSLKMEMAFRVNALINLLTCTLSSLLSLLVLNGFFGHISSLGGWSFTHMLALMGVVLIVEAVFDCWLVPSVGILSDYVTSGELDRILVQPADAQFLISFHRVNIWECGNALVGFGFVLLAMESEGVLSPANLALFIFMLGVGCGVFYCFYLLSNLTAFWFTKIGDIWVVSYSFLEVARFPVSAFPSKLKYVLTFIFPVFFVTNVPAQASLGLLDKRILLESVLFFIILMVLTRWLWSISLRNYCSASS